MKAKKKKQDVFSWFLENTNYKSPTLKVLRTVGTERNFFLCETSQGLVYLHKSIIEKFPRQTEFPLDELRVDGLYVFMRGESFDSSKPLRGTESLFQKYRKEGE